MTITATEGQTADVEVVLSGEQVEELGDKGVELGFKEVDGQTAAELSTQAVAEGMEVFSALQRRRRPQGGV